MKLELVDLNTLSVGELLKHQDEFFYIYATDDKDEPYKICKVAKNSMPDSDCTLIRIPETMRITLPEPKYVAENAKPATAVNPIDWWNKHKVPLTYKFTGWNYNETRGVIFKPESAGIRCVFKDKDEAQEVFDYIRENFYRRSSQADVITVSNIYSDLQLVNYPSEECDRWGWETIDGGPCEYLGSRGVTKTKNDKTFGFTIQRPKLLYDKYGDPLY